MNYKFSTMKSFLFTLLAFIASNGARGLPFSRFGVTRPVLAGLIAATQVNPIEARARANFMGGYRRHNKKSQSSNGCKGKASCERDGFWFAVIIFGFMLVVVLNS
jgi:hypothetical protein